MTNPNLSRRQFAELPGTMWHGSPNGDIGGGTPHYGVHIGTHEAARQALNARIGRPAVGDWDGTREYGKTLLGSHNTGSERAAESHYPSGAATYSDQTPVPMDARPNIQPVRIVGPMTNSPQRPHEDFKANGLMAGQLKRGRAKSGYFYTNIGEDDGSISAVVPNRAHVETYEQHIARRAK